MIFQHYNLVDRLSVIENVLRTTAINPLLAALSAIIRGKKEKAFQILVLGLTEQAYSAVMNCQADKSKE